MTGHDKKTGEKFPDDETLMRQVLWALDPKDEMATLPSPFMRKLLTAMLSATDIELGRFRFSFAREYAAVRMARTLPLAKFRDVIPGCPPLAPAPREEDQ